MEHSQRHGERPDTPRKPPPEPPSLAHWADTEAAVAAMIACATPTVSAPSDTPGNESEEPGAIGEPSSATTVVAEGIPPPSSSRPPSAASSAGHFGFAARTLGGGPVPGFECGDGCQAAVDDGRAPEALCRRAPLDVGAAEAGGWVGSPITELVWGHPEKHRPRSICLDRCALRSDRSKDDLRCSVEQRIELRPSATAGAGPPSLSMAWAPSDGPLWDGLYRLQVVIDARGAAGEGTEGDEQQNEAGGELAAVSEVVWWRVDNAHGWYSGHVRAMVQLCDTDNTGVLSSYEYRRFLDLLGVWGLAPQYTDARWGITWPRLCQHLRCDGATGVTETGLARKYAGQPGLLLQHLHVLRGSIAALSQTGHDVDSGRPFCVSFVVPPARSDTCCLSRRRGRGWVRERSFWMAAW